MWYLLAAANAVFPVLWCTLSKGRQEAVLSQNQSHPERKTLSPYLTFSEDQAGINLFAPSYGAVAEQETCCLLPQESLSERSGPENYTFPLGLQQLIFLLPCIGQNFLKQTEE